MAQGVGGAGEIARTVVLVAGDRAVGGGFGSDQARGVVRPAGGAGDATAHARTGVGDGLGEGVARAVVGVAGGAAGLAHSDWQAPLGVPAGDGGALFGFACGFGDGGGQAAGGVPGVAGGGAQEVGLGGDQAQGALHATGGVALAQAVGLVCAGNGELAQAGAVVERAHRAQGVGDGRGPTAAGGVADLVALDRTGMLGADGPAYVVIGVGGETLVVFVHDAGQGMRVAGVLVEVGVGGVVGVARRQQATGCVVFVAHLHLAARSNRDQLALGVVVELQFAAKLVGHRFQHGNAVDLHIAIGGHPAVAACDTLQQTGGRKLQFAVCVQIGVEPAAGIGLQPLAAVLVLPGGGGCGIGEPLQVPIAHDEGLCGAVAPIEGTASGLKPGTVVVAPAGGEANGGQHIGRTAVGVKAAVGA